MSLRVATLPSGTILSFIIIMLSATSGSSSTLEFIVTWNNKVIKSVIPKLKHDM